MALFHDHFAHSRSVYPIAKVNRVLGAIVIVEHPEAGDEKIRICLVRKLMPFALKPVVGDAAQQGPLEDVNIPKWLDADDLPDGEPSSCFL